MRKLGVFLLLLVMLAAFWARFSAPKMMHATHPETVAAQLPLDKPAPMAAPVPKQPLVQTPPRPEDASILDAHVKLADKQGRLAVQCFVGEAFDGAQLNAGSDLQIHGGWVSFVTTNRVGKQFLGKERDVWLTWEASAEDTSTQCFVEPTVRAYSTRRQS